MRKPRSKIAKFSGILAITLAVFSTGFAVVQQCHAQSVATSITTQHDHNAPAGTHGALSSQSLLTDVCLGVFFLVLIVGRKYLLEQRKSVGNFSRALSWRRVFTFIPPPNLTFSLSLPQLGVIRI